MRHASGHIEARFGRKRPSFGSAFTSSTSLEQSASLRLWIDSSDNPSRYQSSAVPFFALLGAKLAPRGANPCAPEKRASEWRISAPRVGQQDFHSGQTPVRISRIAVAILHCGKLRLSLHPKSRAIVEATINLARALKIETTAEGVETENQLNELRAAGASQAQGYFFAKPMPEHEIAAFLQRVRKPGTSAQATPIRGLRLASSR